MKRVLSCVVLAVAAACASGPQKKTTASSDGETPTPSPRAGAGEAEPKADPKSRAVLDRALELAQRGDYTSAESELRQLLNRSPELDYGWTDLGVVYEREALPQQAERQRAQRPEPVQRPERAPRRSAKLAEQAPSPGVRRSSLQPLPARAGPR